MHTNEQEADIGRLEDNGDRRTDYLHETYGARNRPCWAWWWRSEGFGWPATIAAGILSYIFWKIAISVAIGRYQGALLRAQMDATADAFVDRQRRAKSTLESKK
jgi:hypothetical protein